MSNRHYQFRKLIAKKWNVKKRAIESHDRLCFGQRLPQRFRIVPLDVNVVFAAKAPPNQSNLVVISAQTSGFNIQKQSLRRKTKCDSVMFLFGKTQSEIISVLFVKSRLRVPNLS